MRQPTYTKCTARAFEWRSGFDSSFILGELAKCRTVKDGKCSFKSMERQFWLPILKSAIKADPCARTRKDNSIERALSTPSLTLRDTTAFLDQCNAHFEDSLKRPTKTFFVLCSFTYEGEKLFNTLSDGQHKVLWAQDSKSRAYKAAWVERTEMRHLLKARGVPFNEKGLCDLMVSVRTHDSHQAVIEARDAVDRLRGILNLIANSNRSLNPFSGLGMSKPHAVNRFRPGPYVSVHNEDGSLATKTLWYEPRWSHETPTVKFGDGTAKIRRSISTWWRRSLAGPLSGHATDGLLRYCRALDQHDADAALVGLWSTIEALTCTQNARYEVTVNRVIKMFHDQVAARQIAQHVRERRNSHIHAANSPNGAESEAILLHADLLANRLLSFCIENQFALRNTEELALFLDLSTSEPRLKRERELAAHLIRYMRVM